MARGGDGPEPKVLSVAQRRAQSSSARETTVDDGPRSTKQIMENKTPFDLETAIGNWRAELAHSPAFKQENVDELEAHLRDAVARWKGTGLSSEEAFLIATRRIGHA